MRIYSRKNDQEFMEIATTAVKMTRNLAAARWIDSDDPSALDLVDSPEFEVWIQMVADMINLNNCISLVQSMRAGNVNFVGDPVRLDIFAPNLFENGIDTDLDFVPPFYAQKLIDSGREPEDYMRQSFLVIEREFRQACSTASEKFSFGEDGIADGSATLVAQAVAMQNYMVAFLGWMTGETDKYGILPDGCRIDQCPHTKVCNHPGCVARRAKQEEEQGDAFEAVKALMVGKYGDDEARMHMVILVKRDEFGEKEIAFIREKMALPEEVRPDLVMDQGQGNFRFATLQELELLLEASQEFGGGTTGE